MGKLRTLIIAFALAAWGASVVYVWSPQFLRLPQHTAHAQGTLLNASAQLKSGTTNQVDITFNVVSGAKTYTVQRKGTTTGAIQGAAPTVYTDTNVPDGTWQWEVHAMDGTTSLASVITNFVTIGTGTGNVGDVVVTAVINSSDKHKVDVTYTVPDSIKDKVKYVVIDRDAEAGSTAASSPGIKQGTHPLSFTDSPPAGGWNYGVTAYASQADAQSGTGSLGAGFSNHITVNTDGATVDSPIAGGAGNANSQVGPLGASCDSAAQTAQTAAQGNRLATQDIFTVIAQDGVKSVFRWVLSLVNFLVLLFLLAVAFANILRFQVDTYAVQKVFTPLVLGVLMANFSWLICRFFIEISTILYHALTDPYGGGAGLFKAIAVNGYGLDHLCATAGGQSFAAGLLGAFVGTALILVAGILILTLYVLLVARVWIITLLIIIAPLAFLCLGFPMTQSYFKKWWGMFFNWVFMAPASFLILVLAYQMTKIGTGPNLTKFIIITALLYYAIQVPFKMGGDWMKQWGGYVSQFKKKAVDVSGFNAARDLVKGGYEAQKQLLKDRLKVPLKNSFPGQLVASGQKKFQTARVDIDKQLERAESRGGQRFVDSAKGQRQVGRAGMNEREAEAAANNLKTAEGHAITHALKHDEELGRALEKAGKENTTLSARLARSRLEHMVDELELKQYDIRIEGDERGRKVMQDKDVLDKAKALNDVKESTRLALLDLEAKDPVYQKVKKRRGEVAVEVEKLNGEIDKVRETERKRLEATADYKRADRYTREEMLEEAVETAASSQYKQLKTKQRHLSRIDRVAKQYTQDIDTKFAQAEVNLRNAKIKAAEKSYEAQEATISVDDAIKENTTENTALFANSDLGKWVNARRARWRTFIATNEKEDEEQLERAFYIMFQGTPDEKHDFARLLAEDVAENRNGAYKETMDRLRADMKKHNVKKYEDLPKALPNYDTDYKQFVEETLQPQLEAVGGENRRHFISQVYATRAKELTAAEVKKGQNIVLEEMIAPQRALERSEETEAKLAHISNRLDSLTKSLPKQQEALEKFRTEVAEKSKTATAPEKKALQQDLELREKELKTSENMLSILKTDHSMQEQKLVQDKSSMKYIAQAMKEQANGVLESLPRHIRDQFKVVAGGEWQIAPPEQRRQYDRLKGMLGEALRAKADGRAKNRSVPDIIRELNGIGNDVFDKDLVDAIFRGDVKYLTNTQLGKGNKRGGIRRIEKAASFIYAALGKGRNWEEGTDIREYLINRLDAKTQDGPDAMEQLVVEMAKNQSLASARSGRAQQVYRFVVDTARKMEGSGGKFSVDPEERKTILEEVRQQLLGVNTDRVLSRQFIATMEKIIGPIEKV